MLQALTTKNSILTPVHPPI